MYEPELGGTLQIVRDQMEVTFIGHLLGPPCLRCGRDMVALADWKALSVEDRKLLKPDFVPFCARGLCRSCYTHLQDTDPDALLDYERPTMPIAIFAEEYKAFRDSGMTNQHIAEKLGLIRPPKRWPGDRMRTFYKALDRAKKAGLL